MLRPTSDCAPTDGTVEARGDTKAVDERSIAGPASETQEASPFVVVHMDSSGTAVTTTLWRTWRLAENAAEEWRRFHDGNVRIEAPPGAACTSISTADWSSLRPGTQDWNECLRDVMELIGISGSFACIKHVISARALLDLREWLRLLGLEWSRCDNIGAYLPTIRRLLAEARESDLAYMMTPEEREKWTSLPKTFVAYRGCYLDLNWAGLSYSLDGNIALKFAGEYRRFRGGTRPALITAKCKRSRAVLKSDRCEQEVIVLRRQIVQVEPVIMLNGRARVAP